MTPTNPDDARYTLTELADLAGVTPRTVRYYLAQGLLPGVGVAGPGAKYDDTHLARLRLIRRLQAEHQPLAEIRRRLETVDDATVLALDEPADAGPPDSALEYLRRVTGSPPATTEPRASSAFPPASASSLPPSLAARTLQRRFVSESMPALRDVPPALPPRYPAGMPAQDLPTEVAPRSRRSQWDHIVLGPDVELHVRRPLTRSTAKRVDRLIEIARDLLEEESS
jgi:DNA-binding transcriptional MerR regulator